MTEPRLMSKAEWDADYDRQIRRETPLSPSQAARYIPAALHAAFPPTEATISAWMHRGLGDVTLEHYSDAGELRTSREALDRFLVQAKSSLKKHIAEAAKPRTIADRLCGLLRLRREADRAAERKKLGKLPEQYAEAHRRLIDAEERADQAAIEAAQEQAAELAVGLGKLPARQAADELIIRRHHRAQRLVDDLPARQAALGEIEEQIAAKTAEIKRLQQEIKDLNDPRLAAIDAAQTAQGAVRELADLESTWWELLHPAKARTAPPPRYIRSDPQLDGAIAAACAEEGRQPRYTSAPQPDVARIDSRRISAA